MKNNYDVIVIGAGPAGISACIYLQQSNKKVLLLEKSTPGGRMLQASLISNYPGMVDSGENIALKMFEMLDLSKIDFMIDEVTEVKKEEQIIVTTKTTEYICDKLIVATGFVNKLLNDTQDKFVGRGVSYCALCDAPLVKGKDILVYANGKKAEDELKYLSTLANHIYLVTNELNVDISNVEPLFGAKIASFNGTSKLTSVTLDDGRKIDVSMAFIYSGYTPAISFIKNLDITNNSGLIEIDNNYETKIKGIYAIGDICNHQVKQVSCAVGDGAYVASIILR